MKPIEDILALDDEGVVASGDSQFVTNGDERKTADDDAIDDEDKTVTNDEQQQHHSPAPNIESPQQVDDHSSSSSGWISQAEKDAEVLCEPLTALPRQRQQQQHTLPVLVSINKVPLNHGSSAKTEKHTYVGVRVYAKHETTGQRFWGVIVREYQKMVHSSRPTTLYTVWFDDGEATEDVAGHDISTEAEYNKNLRQTNGNADVPNRPPHLRDFKLDEKGLIIYESKLLPITVDSSISIDEEDKASGGDANGGVATYSSYDDATGISSENQWAGMASNMLSPQQLFTEACGKCSYCKRSACGKCASCRHNNGEGSSNSTQAAAPHVCFRKMCLRISEDKKAQPAKGFPKDWSFFFQSSSARYSCPGEFFIMSPVGLKLRSVAAACKRYPSQLTGVVNANEFYQHIGEDKPGSAYITSHTKGKRKVASGSPERKQKIAKSDDRVLIYKREIGSRVWAKFENGQYYWGVITKKSKKKSKKNNIKRFHYAVKFDDGDSLSDISDDTEYRRTDLKMYTEEQIFELKRELPPPRLSDQSRPEKGIIAAYTPAELYKFRCNKCSFCAKKPCNRCNSCRNNVSSAVQEIECCLQNMCCKLDKDRKRQPAPGLPDGWTFYGGQGPFTTITAPDGNSFDGIDGAIAHCEDDIKDHSKAVLAFQKHTGGEIHFSDKSHELVGKQYRVDWIDVDGRVYILYGTITDCERDELDSKHLSFTVIYDKQALADVNGKKLAFLKNVPRTQRLTYSEAMGGFNTYREKLLRQEPFPDEEGTHGLRWRVPETRVEDLVDYQSNLLPRLVLTWNGFRIVLFVNKSGIPDSGYGVFIKCTSLVPGRRKMRLDGLELLDLGVYAPFRKEDLKESCVFCIKNFIFDGEPEGWAFDTVDNDHYQYDITDDCTGNLHSKASQCLLPYINECKSEDARTVQAEHDPQGVVHYLLGSKTQNLVLPTDSPMEIFINYGHLYEKVRVRKKYSWLRPHKQLEYTKNPSKEACECFDDVVGFEERDVASCIRFLSNAFPEERESSVDSARRALAIAVLLQRRARVLLRDGSAASSPSLTETGCDLALCQEVVTILVLKVGEANLIRLSNDGNIDDLTTFSVRPLLTNLSIIDMKKALSCYIRDEKSQGSTE